MGFLGEDFVFGGISLIFDVKAPDLYKVTYDFNKKQSVGIFVWSVPFWFLVIGPIFFISYLIIGFLIEYVFMDTLVMIWGFFVDNVSAYYVDIIESLYNILYNKVKN